MDKGKALIAKLKDVGREAGMLGLHGLVVVLSAGIAWSLPNIARQFLTFWSRVEHEQVLLLAMEVCVALCLIAVSSYLWQAFQDRRQAVMARGAGLISFFSSHNPVADRAIRRLKQEQSLGRTVLAIGVTGHGTVIDDKAEIHALLETCLEAKLILLNPFSEEAVRRAQSLSHLDVTPARLRDELVETISLIKRLRAAGKVIRLKLYSDRPHVRMIILGDYLWLQHYHTGLDVRWMPEYVFQHKVDHHGLYTLFYQYFTKRWENQDIPEYDFQTNELVYRTRNGSELRREPFGLDQAESHEERDLAAAEPYL
ncbi:conserved protein of unknown function [Nitrospira japonica]|uniref:Uncharacterized protein n=2 Tax=Nitrospira japonica TaxID=1325564 RepID=A0A1W1I1D5_9BACT|nr:conserved protein of unknown function [Nitrospira japonica]